MIPIPVQPLMRNEHFPGRLVPVVLENSMRCCVAFVFDSGENAELVKDPEAVGGENDPGGDEIGVGGARFVESGGDVVV